MELNIFSPGLFLKDSKIFSFTEIPFIILKSWNVLVMPRLFIVTGSFLLSSIPFEFNLSIFFYSC